MEILEKQDPEKKRLMDEAKKHKQNLANEVKAVSQETEKIVTNALLIGGALVLTYFIISSLGGSGKKKKSKSIKLVTQPSSEASQAQDEADSGDSILSQIGNRVASEATVFLLNLAKEKLMEYLQANKKQEVESKL